MFLLHIYGYLSLSLRHTYAYVLYICVYALRGEVLRPPPSFIFIYGLPLATYLFLFPSFHKHHRIIWVNLSF